MRDLQQSAYTWASTTSHLPKYLRIKVRNAFLNYELHTMADVVRTDSARWERMRGLGVKSRKALLKALELDGFLES